MQNQKITHFQNATYRVLSERKNITASFPQHLKFPGKMSFAEIFWVNRGKSKQKKKNQETIHFEIAVYRVLEERRNITAPFAKHLRF